MQFADLYDNAALIKLDAAFLAFVASRDDALHQCLLKARHDPTGIVAKAASELLLALTPHVDAFIAELFGITAEVEALTTRHLELSPLYSVKRLFVQRKAANKYKGEAADRLNGPELAAQLDSMLGGQFTELAFAKKVVEWQKDEASHADKLDIALQYAAWALLTSTGREKHHAGVLFKAPHKLEMQHLVPTAVEASKGYTTHTFPIEKLRRRDGFKLTDKGTDLKGALDQANYCIWCHEQGKDSCSKGFVESKPGADGAPVKSFKKNPLGIALEGCPLHVLLVAPGAALAPFGADALAAAPFSSCSLDLVAAPDDWRVAARLPGDRGLVLGHPADHARRRCARAQTAGAQIAHAVLCAAGRHRRSSG